MKWQGRRESDNVEDRRGMSTGGMVLGGGGILGLLAYLVFALMSGGEVDPSQIPQLSSPVTNNQPMSPAAQQEDEARARFVKVVLADTEEVWGKIFAQYGQRYPAPTLVLYRDMVRSACGNASSASGPFYCPGDYKLYIDLSFYEELQRNLNAPGDFAMAYVVAHEVGHHIQTINGTSEKVQRMRMRVGEADGNKLSVMQELQADFLAGVWAHYAQKMLGTLEPGDIEEALNAANQIGDDRLQKRSTGTVVPDAFTHGSSAQRMYWFKKGFESGDLAQGNTFEGVALR
jgi:predicted metalloprotease